jgi:hypothetical protein
MPLNILLLHCLLVGKTSCGESGANIRVDPEAGETILFFRIDDDLCPLQKEMSEGQNQGKICDVIIFYAKKGEERRTLCLVELKRGQTGTAPEQIKKTYDFLSKKLKRIYSGKIQFKACIRSHSSSSQDKRAIEELKDIFGGNGNVKITQNEDIGAFLRRSSTERSKKKRKS